MSAPSPLVTVITPAFQVERFVAEAIASVGAQTHADFEHLIVDDGSTDGTLDIARAAAARDPRVRVFAEPHRGASAARNHACAQSLAPYVAFLDADDIWEPDFLAAQLERLATEPEDCVGVFCWSNHALENGQLAPGVLRPEPGKYDLFRMLLGICPPGNGSALLLRREALLTAGRFDETIIAGQDTDMWLRMLEPARSYFVCHANVLVRYRQRAGSLTNLHLARRLSTKDDILRRYIDRFTPHARAQLYYSFYRLAMRYGYPQIAQKWAASALKADPLTFIDSDSSFDAARLVMLGARADAALRTILHAPVRVRRLIGRML